MCNMIVLQKKVCLLTLFFLMLPVCVSAVPAIESDIFEQPVTVKFSNNELGVVLKRLSDDTGIQIIYDEKISKKMVAGSYKNVPFLTVMQRLLGGENHTLTMNQESRTLLVKGFGKVHYVTTGTRTGGEHITDIGISFSELRVLHEKQYKEYVEQLNDMDEFLEEVGMTRGELRNLHERQSVQFKQESQNPDQYLTEIAMTRGQLQAMREKQLADFNSEFNNDKTELTELAMTLGEHRAMLADDASEYEKQQKDDTEYLPEIGMTRGEHRRLLAQQMKEFKQSLTK